MSAPRSAHAYAPRAEIVGGVALLGMMLGMLALGIGQLLPGVTGLMLIGLAAGFSGTLRTRLLVAVLIWVAASTAALAGLPFGELGFALSAPVVASLLFVALGQAVGVLAGCVLHRVEPSGLVPAGDSGS